jgi:DNA-binding IclR family transcriptional regulator
VDAIRRYVREEDQRPSKNKTVEYSPFGVSKTSRILDQLVEKEAVARDEETRYGNHAQVYSVIATSL